jgi:hypothetical protein
MSSPDATQGKNVQQKQEKSKNEWLLQDHSRVVGKNEAACAADASREVVERWLPKG